MEAAPVDGATTFSTTTLSIMTLSTTTLSVRTLSITTLSIKSLISDTQHNNDLTLSYVSLC